MTKQNNTNLVGVEVGCGGMLWGGVAAAGNNGWGNVHVSDRREALYAMSLDFMILSQIV